MFFSRDFIEHAAVVMSIAAMGAAYMFGQHMLGGIFG